MSFRRYDVRMEGYMTLRELADFLGLKSTGSLRVQIARGALKAERVGERTFLVTNEEAERYRDIHLGQKGKRIPAPGRKPNKEKD